MYQLTVPCRPHPMLVCPVSRGELVRSTFPSRCVSLQAEICEMVGEGEGAWSWGTAFLVGLMARRHRLGPGDRLGHLPEVNRDKRFPEWGPHGPGGSHCTQIALLRFAVCSRRNSRLIGDTRTPLRKLRPWKTATLTTGEFITGFWGSLRRHPAGFGHCWTKTDCPPRHQTTCHD